MRKLWLTIVLVLLPLPAAAVPADKLAEARGQIAAGHVYTADALLQEVVHDEDAAVVELQEALFVQCMIYSGDVLGSVALMKPMALATRDADTADMELYQSYMDSGDNEAAAAQARLIKDRSAFKGEISRQLVYARRAFATAMNSYLNATVMDAGLDRVQLELPVLADDEVAIMLETLNDGPALRQINAAFAADPAPGRGLLAQVNLYSYYLALSDAVPGGNERDMALIRQRFTSGQRFDNLHYLDWAARVALDMHALLSEPDGPDLLGLARRCDQRIIEQAGDESNVYVKNARERAGKY